MYRIRSFLTDSRTLSAIGLIALIAFLFLGASTLQMALTWAAIIAAMVLFIWLLVWFLRRRKARRASEDLGTMLEQQAEGGKRGNNSKTNQDIAALRARMQDAVRTIKTSKLGQTSGRAALYELPWYITIGNPAAGKSTALVNSGLTFPFQDDTGQVIKGIGGTRNCDWFFTTEGILLDTAGRYSVHEEDREEWLGFLDQLKKHRSRAPINGIIVTVSIPELIDNPPAFAINLAKNLRQRVQELTERLEVFAPVYVMFSKADLIAGFNEFFHDLDWNERDRVWGATLPYQRESRNDAIALFDKHFDELYQGLREMSIAQLSAARTQEVQPGVLTFPLEFAAIKPALRGFIATFFEDNPYQFEPVFRGFYITSALQTGEPHTASSRQIAERFELQGNMSAPEPRPSEHGFFLKELFSKVIFADRDLVQQYTSRNKSRLRYAGFFAAIAALGIALGGWSWSYVNNRTLVENVQADLDQAVRVQQDRFDLQSRMEALQILQDRIDQLERLSEERPFSVTMGLFQGDELAKKLKREYYAGMSNIMLTPVAGRIETFLTSVNDNADKLQEQEKGDKKVNVSKVHSTTYKDMDPTSVEDAYNALKTYIMLASREHIEVGHLSDQLTRFWRGWLETNRGDMSREQMVRSAERLLSFHLEHANDPDWPLIQNNLSIVDNSRDNLRKVVRGMAATERVYAVIRARASTRFPAITVDNLVGPENAGLVTGGHVISGAFTKQAWQEYVKEALKDAAINELASADWVLKTSTHDDLSLEGSPEQIQKSLVAMYKKEYAEEWSQFLSNVSVAGFNDFSGAVTAMNRIGDKANSPVAKVLQTAFEETSWDNPAMANVGAERAQKGFVEWFKRSVLRMSPGRVSVDVNVTADKLKVAKGPVGERFSGLDRIMAVRENNESMGGLYLKQLAKIRSRMNQLTNEGDPGPGSIKFMRETVEGGNSELAETLRYIDEQMLAGMPKEQRADLRSLLVAPLLNTYAAVIEPSERELNKTWRAQVFDPFNRKLASKYPFAPESDIEAAPAEIAQIFGPEGAIAKYVEKAMGPLVVRRGNTIAARTWGDLGLRIKPEFQAEFASWVRPLEGGAAGGGDAASPQTAFMLMPHPAPGTTEYSIEIDGQQLRYRNGAAQWANFVWPNPAGSPGAKIVATTFEGRNVEIINYSGRFGLEKLINSAERMRKPDGSFQLTWKKDDIKVNVDLRVISSVQAQSDPNGQSRAGLRGVKLPELITGSNTFASSSPVAANANGK